MLRVLSRIPSHSARKIQIIPRPLTLPRSHNPHIQHSRLLNKDAHILIAREKPAFYHFQIMLDISLRDET